MSILKSTKSGYNYYRWKDLLQNCCEFEVNGEPTNCYATVNEDGSINIDASEEPIGMRMYTKLAQRGQDMQISFPRLSLGICGDQIQDR